MKKRAVVVCPGRGSYTAETLGYLRQFKDRAFIDDVDARRRKLGEPAVTELDGAPAFKPALHTKGEHASALIYTCALADFAGIGQFETVAVTGNSMGWYLALACGGSLDQAGGFEVVNTMGGMMKAGVIGGQVIYPISDERWRPSPERRQIVADTVSRLKARPGVEIFDSIHLGGYAVLGANQQGIAALLKELPPVDHYPFQLINHAAFHTPLLREISQRAFESLPRALFHRPRIPLIDGRGHIWQPYATSVDELHQYTFGAQVVEPYDFSKAITVALKEFAPDALVLLGPGSSLGPPVGQILVENDWLGIRDKAALQAREPPFMLSMGRPEQRQLVVQCP